MLAASVEPALSPYKDQRHAHQVSVVCWIQEAFAGHQAVLEASVAESKGNVSSVEAEKGTCEAAVASADDALVKLHDVVAEAKSKSGDALAASQTAEAALNSAR